MSAVKKSQTKQEAAVKHQRGHLSRRVITLAGLRVAHSEGLESLTMKRVATELSITPMAIYRHFKDKTDLIDAVLNAFVSEQDICNHGVSERDWGKWLTATYKKMYQGLQSMPSVYPYLSTASRFGAGASDVVEQTLYVMQNAGFSMQESTQAANALNGFVIGCAIMDNAFYQSLPIGDELSQEVAQNQHLPGIDSGLRLIISALEVQHKTTQSE